MKKKNKVLLAGNSEMVIFKFRKELIEELLRQEFEVYVSFPITEFGDGITISKQYGCTFLNTKVSSHGINAFSDLKLICFYKKMLKSIKPDVVLTYTIKPNIYLSIAAKRQKIPVIINVSGLGTALENKGILQLITSFLYQIATKSDQRVFFQNSENEAFFANRHIADGKRSILPGSGVNLQQFVLLPYPSNKIIHFLFMARIMKEKGIDQYIEAARAIHQEYPNTVFHVLGVCDNQKYFAILKQYTTEGIIKYEGQQKDIIKYQKISSCTIHPTYYPEGISNVLLESSACGRPIITTDRSGCREVIEDGVNGFICEQRNSLDLIHKIKKFLSLTWEQRRQMGIAGRRKVESKFDRKMVVEAYLDEVKKSVREK